MSMVIGRLGWGDLGLSQGGPTRGIEIDAVDHWTYSSGDVEVRGVIHVPDFDPVLHSAIGNALRHQLVGMIRNPEQTHIPIRWRKDISVDGLYTIVGGDIDFVTPWSFKNGVYPFSIQLREAASKSTPLMESRFAGGLVTNSHSITTSEAPFWAAIPAVATDVRMAINPSFVRNRTAEDGPVTYYEANLAKPERSTYWSLPINPVRFYRGACTLEIPVTAPGCDPDPDSPYMVVTQRQWERKPMEWRMTNGLLRLIPTFGDDDGSLFAISVFNGTSWSDYQKFYLEGTTEFGRIDDPDEREYSALIVRNAPEEVSVALNTGSTDQTFGRSRLRMNFTLRRGSRFVALIIQYDRPSGAGTSENFRIGRNSSEAANAITGGIRATNNDADGNRYVLGTNDSFSSDLTNGSITHTSQTSPHYFIVGSVVGGGGATSPDQAQEIIYQGHAGLTEWVRHRVTQEV